MAILNLLGAKAPLNASPAGVHDECSPRTPLLAPDGHFSEYPTLQELTRPSAFARFDIEHVSRTRDTRSIARWRAFLGSHPKPLPGWHCRRIVIDSFRSW